MPANQQDLAACWAIHYLPFSSSSQSNCCKLTIKVFLPHLNSNALQPSAFSPPSLQDTYTSAHTHTHTTQEDESLNQHQPPQNTGTSYSFNTWLWCCYCVPSSEYRAEDTEGSKPDMVHTPPSWSLQSMAMTFELCSVLLGFMECPQRMILGDKTVRGLGPLPYFIQSSYTFCLFYITSFIFWKSFIAKKCLKTTALVEDLGTSRDLRLNLWKATLLKW